MQYSLANVFIFYIFCAPSQEIEIEKKALYTNMVKENNKSHALIEIFSFLQILSMKYV